MTQEKDIVLIYFEDKPLLFARIEEITADIKPDWYHTRLLILQIPVQVVTWLLRASYIDGTEFTMGGKRIRMEQVECPVDPATQKTRNTGGKKKAATEKPIGAEIISLSDLKKK